MSALLHVPFVLIFFFVAVVSFIKKHHLLGCVTFVVCYVFNVYSNGFAFSLIKSPGPSLQKIRIMSYNVDAKFGYYENLNSWREIVHFVDSINPDIILPQEFSFYGGDSLRIALNKRYPYNTKQHFENRYYVTDMVFSRYPLERVDYLLGFGKTIYVMDVNIDGKVVKVVNCHLHSNNFTSEVESGKHNFLHKIKEGYNERAKEVDAIVDSLKSCTNVPLIVCGDMNDVSGSYTIRTLQDSLNLKDAWWQGGTGFGFTYHGYGVMRFRLDHILYNKYLELQSVSVPHVGFSDHWPVVADLILK